VGREGMIISKEFYFVWLKLKVETHMSKGKYVSKIKTVIIYVGHIDDYFPKFSTKNILHLYDIFCLRKGERKNLIDLPYIDDHSFYF
jgi:hypothetical protein